MQARMRHAVVPNGRLVKVSKVVSLVSLLSSVINTNYSVPTEYRVQSTDYEQGVPGCQSSYYVLVVLRIIHVVFMFQSWADWLDQYLGSTSRLIKGPVNPRKTNKVTYRCLFSF